MFDYSQLVYNYNTVIAVHTDTEVVAYIIITMNLISL